MAIITQKLIRIASRGRYERTTPGRAIIGPQIAFYNERISEIEHLLKKYPRIKILEKLDDCRTMNLTLANYNKDNNVVSKPVSMVEPPKQEDSGENPNRQFRHMLEYKDEDGAGKEQVSPEPEKEGEPTEQVPVENADSNPTDAEPEKEGEPTVASEAIASDKAPVEEKPAEVVHAAEPDTKSNNQQGKKNRNKDNKGNKQQHDKSTEVTPEEPK